MPSAALRLILPLHLVLLTFIDLVPLHVLQAALGIASVTAKVTGVDDALDDFSECFIAAALWLCCLICLLLLRR